MTDRESLIEVLQTALENAETKGNIYAEVRRPVVFGAIALLKEQEAVAERSETMSGGSLNYFYSELESHVGDFGDKELDELVEDLSKLFHDREWYLSSDTNEGTWREARDEFKTKWFTPLSREERVKKYLDEIRDEVLDAFGLSDKRCKNCKHWTQDKRDNYEKFGVCDITKGCLMHRNESCEKYDSK